MKDVSLPLRIEATYAEALLRSALGLLFLLQGIFKFVQISKVGYAAFVGSMTAPFASTFLPNELTSLFFYVLPVIEIVLGILLLLGYRRVWALIGTGILLIVLLFGHLVGQMPFDLPFLLLLVVAAALVLPARPLWGRMS